MTRANTEAMAEKPGAVPEGRGRKSREYGSGVSGVTATDGVSWTEAGARLMDDVVSRDNMMAAYRRVVSNKGAPGVDEMTVDQLQGYLKEHWPRIREELLEGTYLPQPVLKVEIPKPDGGIRTLGIPTVVDRLIQQALNQQLTPLYDPHFSESSYGYRPGRSAHQALQAARRHVAGGRRWVIDMDLEKFFDLVNHDIMMSRLARKIEDKRVLRLIRRYLQAGLLEGGVTSPRAEGTPQGGPLSPLLSNILLDELDKELERRGHAFCRYADDCNIYVRTQRSGERAFASVEQFLKERLRLTVNRKKSAVDRPWKRIFLGYSMTNDRTPRLKVGKTPVQRLVKKVRKITKKGRGRNIKKVIEELTPKLRGWVVYFRDAEVKGIFQDLDGWVRRKLRCIIWRQWKRPSTRARKLIGRGLTEERAYKSAYNGRGPWWNSGASHMNHAFGKAYFTELGLLSLVDGLRRFQRTT
jgi:RNA-directed DNA polymerase